MDLCANIDNNFHLKIRILFGVRRHDLPAPHKYGWTKWRQVDKKEEWKEHKASSR